MNQAYKKAVVTMRSTIHQKEEKNGQKSYISKCVMKAEKIDFLHLKGSGNLYRTICTYIYSCVSFYTVVLVLSQ